MASRRITFKVAPAAAAELEQIADADGTSVTQLVGEALEDAVAHGLDAEAEPFAAGSRVLAARLDGRLVGRAEAKAAAAGVSFGSFVRAALGGYLVADEEDGEDDPWAVLLDRDRRQAAIAGAVAGGLRRVSAGQRPEPLPAAPPPLRPRPDGLVVVRDCLHVTRELPDAAGYVLCSICSRYGPVAPPGSREHTHVVMREQLRREQAANR